jgi:hypothetical protein
MLQPGNGNDERRAIERYREVAGRALRDERLWLLCLGCTGPPLGGRRGEGRVAADAVQHWDAWRCRSQARETTPGVVSRGCRRRRTWRPWWGTARSASRRTPGVVNALQRVVPLERVRGAPKEQKRHGRQGQAGQERPQRNAEHRVSRTCEGRCQIRDGTLARRRWRPIRWCRTFGWLHEPGLSPRYRTDKTFSDWEIGWASLGVVYPLAIA